MFQSGDEFNDDLDLDTASAASGFRREEPENSAFNSTTQNVRRLMASATEQQSTSNFIFDTVLNVLNFCKYVLNFYLIYGKSLVYSYSTSISEINLRYKKLMNDAINSGNRRCRRRGSHSRTRASGEPGTHSIGHNSRVFHLQPTFL